MARAAASMSYGGQAVVEGVMIRGPRHMAIAARAPDGSIRTYEQPLSGVLTGRVRLVPVIRGAIVLYETLALGLRALSWSSRVAAGEHPQQLSRAQLVVTLLFTTSFAGAIFFVAPVLATGWISEVAGGSEYIEVTIEGVMRLAMLVGYIWLIGKSPEIRRVFAYHGAEHRAIHAYEHQLPLTPDNIRRFPNAHPRCGTAFLLTVMVVSLVVFIALGTPPIWVRVVERVLLVPVIAAFAYEVLRFGQRHEGSRIVRWLYRPNIWLQSLTTRDPDDGQIEIAAHALRRAIALELSEPVTQVELAEGPLA